MTGKDIEARIHERAIALGYDIDDLGDIDGLIIAQHELIDDYEATGNLDYIDQAIEAWMDFR